MPAMGESVSEGTILEWAKQPGEAVEEDETVVEISTDKVDAEVPAPASGTIEEILAQAGDTVTVGQVIARMTTSNGASAAAAAKAPEPTSAPRPQASDPRRAAARRPQGHARRPPRSPRRAGSTSPRSRAAAPRAGSRRPTCSPPRTTAARRPPAAAAAEATPLKGASAVLARYMDESRAIPTATSFRTITVTTLDERRKQLKAEGQRVSFTHLIAYAIARAATEQMPVMARAFQEIDGKPHVRRRRRRSTSGSPSTSSARTVGGR